MYAESREFADVLHSDIADTVCITATNDWRQISTLVPFAELDTQGVALHSDLLRRAVPAHVACRFQVPIMTLGRFWMLALISRHRAHLAWLWLAWLVSKTGIRR